MGLLVAMQDVQQLYDASTLMIDRIDDDDFSLWELEFSIDESYRI